MKKYLLFFVSFLFLTTLVGCGKEKVFKLETSEVTLYLGETYTPKFIIQNIKKDKLEYNYHSDIIEIKDGVIYSKAYGTCEIIISIADKKVEDVILKINIVQKLPEELICEEELNLIVNQPYKINVSILPADASQEVKFVPLNEKIIKVDENGNVTALSEGETYLIIYSVVSKKVRIQIPVYVKKPNVEEITSIEKIDLEYNEQYQLSWKITPLEADQEVIFESLDSKIASVDQNGLITAHKYGTTIIKIISSREPTKFASVEINVSGDKTTDLIINAEEIELKVGEEYNLNYTILPSTAYQECDIMISDDSGLEYINNNILAKKVGEYQIEFKTVDGTNISKKVTVKVIGNGQPIFKTTEEFENTILNYNETFDPLEGIRAFDDEDGEISSINVTGEVLTYRYGEYQLLYSAQDSNGNEIKLDRIVKVEWGYDVTVIGHAGSFYGVPNSEEAIMYAVKELHYPAIEIDLKQTKDGVFVLSHDPTWGNVSLEDTNYADLKEVEYTVTKSTGVIYGSSDSKKETYTSKICTFERFMEICKEYHVIAIVELKTSKGISNWTELNAPHTSRMSAIMEIIEKYDMLEQVVFLSSQEQCLNWVKTNGYEYIPCQYLTLSSCENEKTYEIVKKYNLDISFNVRDGIQISDEWLEKYRALGCKLAVFTFEQYATYKDIQTWIDRGVDYVTTDWHELDKLNFSK